MLCRAPRARQGASGAAGRSSLPGLHAVATGRSVVCNAADLHRRDLLLGTAGGMLGLMASGTMPGPVAAASPSIYDFSALIEEQERSLSYYKDQVLVVNVNYPGLRTLYNKYKADGFNVICFPCNQFGGQAPGTSEEERAWAVKKLGFSVDVFDKILVNGPDAHPLYKYMKKAQPIAYPNAANTGRPNGDVTWNYEKFIVDRSGKAVKRYKSAYDPLEFEGDIRLLLAGKDPLPVECIAHPGRKVCKVDRILGLEEPAVV